ncbi:hypothetical protein D3C72_1871510 [compost metagenome]
MENGLASMYTPRACSISKVSRALWPSAITTWSDSSCSPFSSTTPRSWRCSPSPSSRTSVTLCSKRISPPSSMMVARIFSTIVTSLKVPMCGLAT